ncbi:hypothetical protein CBR_g34479 [Chara braunii]|uniref:Uncharacterized protein n=1 Tax=Chara braunii TaxID=69332 RepID=A0A388LIV3_CHABU|nr:hypothetical protein CBR_g34479 [Chara braunii]|eukprot:GBG82197.1 hypothetical protein CBR_g34479 [Chara braunii]
MVDLRSGKSTVPQSEAEQERIAAILRERKEKKELLKQAKLKAIAEEQAAKKKKLEEEMLRLQQEEEEKRKVAEEEAAAEEEEVEEESLERRRGGERGESSSTKAEDKWMEKKISEWVANLSLGEDEEAMLYVPQEEKEAFPRELEAKEDPLGRQTMEDEKRLEWKLRLAREKKTRREEANRMAKEVEKIQTVSNFQLVYQPALCCDGCTAAVLALYVSAHSPSSWSYRYSVLGMFLLIQLVVVGGDWFQRYCIPTFLSYIRAQRQSRDGFRPDGRRTGAVVLDEDGQEIQEKNRSLERELLSANDAEDIGRTKGLFSSVQGQDLISIL